MPEFESSGTVAERIIRGLQQMSAEAGAIVPFPCEFSTIDILSLMQERWAATQLAELLNTGWTMTHYVYRSDEGLPIFVVLRFDKPGHKKKIKPLRVQRLCGALPKLVLKHLDGARPLYNLHELVARPDAPVLVVEGEKAADAATAILPDYVCTTWIGGAQSVGTADLSPLAGRSVTIWPDNDPEGVIAAEKLAARLLGS